MDTSSRKSSFGGTSNLRAQPFEGIRDHAGDNYNDHVMFLDSNDNNYQFMCPSTSSGKASLIDTSNGMPGSVSLAEHYGPASLADHVVFLDSDDDEDLFMTTSTSPRNASILGTSNQLPYPCEDHNQDLFINPSTSTTNTFIVGASSHGVDSIEDHNRNAPIVGTSSHRVHSIEDHNQDLLMYASTSTRNASFVGTSNPRPHSFEGPSSIANPIEFVDSDNDNDLLMCASNEEQFEIPTNAEFNCDETRHCSSNAVPGFSEYLNIGQPNCVCQYCGAIMWCEERLKKSSKNSPKFKLYCSQGDVELVPSRPLPHPLHDLYHSHDRKSRFFLENIRSFNSMFAFTSMGGKIDSSMNDGNAPPTFVMNGENYHLIGSLLPLPDQPPKFAQLYIYDTDNEISNRMAAVGMEEDNLAFRASIVADIREALHSCDNPYVETYNTVRNTLHSHGVPNVRLKILGKRGRDGRRYDLPTASEVAALIVGDFDGTYPDRDVIVEYQSGLLKRVSTFEPSYWPLQYPLLFPRGEDGYSKNIEFRDNARKATRKIKFITQLEWVGYRIQQRETSASTIVFSRRLFHQFLVDSFSTIESGRLRYLKEHQKDLRADMYKGLTEAILRGDLDATNTGKRIVLPASFVGGARYMIQNYQDAMSICAWAGYPDLFVTFTCNHKWPEIVDFLKTHHLTPGDRPDLVSRLFKIKLDQLIKDIKAGQIFGKVRAVVYTIEFQKRGLPHAHILIFLQSAYRIVHPRDIDKIISAEIPDKYRDPELFEIVSSLMIHGQCGDKNKKSPCMQKGKCSKYFPKKFVNNTIIDPQGYPVYRRRDNGVSIDKGNFVADNSFVVPYNRHLLLKYNAHINVEWCNQSRSIKYLFKYVNKGHDRVTAGFYHGATDADNAHVYDEIKMYYDCRYLSACEAVWRIFVFDVNYREPSVERLNFHLENEQSVVFPDEASIEDVVSRPYAKHTKFLAWMDANKRYPCARDLTYAEFPTKFVWRKDLREWKPREKGFSIGRLHFVAPGSGPKFYLRTLLAYVKGATSFDDIKTVNNVTYNNYKDACFALGLMDDDTEFIQCIKETSYWGSGVFLRNLFASLLLSAQLHQPNIVWDNVWEDLSDDIQRRQRRLLRVNDLVLTPGQLQSYALAEIEVILQRNGKSLKDYPGMPLPDDGLMADIENRLIYDELNYDRHSLSKEHDTLLSAMTTKQTGLRSKGEIVLTVASSGPNHPVANLIRRAKLIIWDEAPMMHKHCFEAVDRTLKDIMKNENYPFGGKVVVLGGDFRQILPVIPKGTRYEIVQATINSSHLWQHCEVLTLTTNMRLLAGCAGPDMEDRKRFSDWILGIGNGTIGCADDEYIKTDIPHDLLIHINDYILDLLPGEEVVYKSYDSPCNDNPTFDTFNDVHTPEFLNTIVSSGIPNHKLRLKVGVPVMLMRNMDQSSGMCNGTRLIITRLGRYAVEGKIISGSNIGDRVFIPRLSLVPSDKRLPFKFQRRQFPLVVCFAMTINKSQGQSLKHVGVYLPQSIFSHGQLYVALSRVTSREGLKILITDDSGEDVDSTDNVVYIEVFRNL
ncbi:ATP-dependent DNA helicase PIF1 [Trifolium medium]|uniref:ATP-dependent DNA helicase n=1 Tax=Trifolium medium TaxID=97028 RepID=A0A392LWC6_9FABA|nr:ATP-dependent DNA helicase PIF1 [Trifolium medium]